MKICTKCKLTKELSEFYKDNRKNDGLQSHCKKCFSISSKEKKEKEKTILSIYKICSVCKIEQHISLFYKNNRTHDGLNCSCKKCTKKKNIEYRKNNKEKIFLSKKNYRINHFLEIKQKKRIYYFNNLEKYKIENKKHREENKELHMEYGKKYRQNNPLKIKNYLKNYRKTEIGKTLRKNNHHKRRALTKTGDVTTNQLLKLQQDAKKCYWCNASLKNKNVHIDHYIPLSKGGEHTISNLVISCAKCNLIKNAKDPLVFANSIGRLL